MSGVEDHNYPAFHEAAKLLREAGHEPVNPAQEGRVEGWGWSDYMRRGLRQMLGCEAVAVLPEWIDSRGASLEVDVARQLGMPVRPVADWL
jgi:hypothetical protein